MKFLYPGGGQHNLYGSLVTPGTYGIPEMIKNGGLWAADNQAFTKGFDADVFFPWLDSMESFRENCIFIACPDHVGDARKTLGLFEIWQCDFDGWPLAFVAQDGQEDLPFPPAQYWSTLFVGGSTEWKERRAAIGVIKRAQALEKHVHIGRVNWWRRYRLFAQIEGSDDFTCDGNRQRYEGSQKTIKAWLEYQKRSRYVLKLW